MAQEESLSLYYASFNRTGRENNRTKQWAMGARPQATVLSHDLLSAKQSTGEQGQSPLHPLEIIKSLK